MLSFVAQSWLLITAALVGLLLAVIAAQAVVVRLRRMRAGSLGRTGYDKQLQSGTHGDEIMDPRGACPDASG